MKRSHALNQLATQFELLGETKESAKEKADLYISKLEEKLTYDDTTNLLFGIKNWDNENE
jgi:hypothetical protein